MKFFYQHDSFYIFAAEIEHLSICLGNLTIYIPVIFVIINEAMINGRRHVMIVK